MSTRAPRRRASPTGTKLTVHEGDLTVTTPGAVIDGVEVHGLLIVNAPDVVIKNSRILGRAVNGSTGLVSNVRSGLPFTIQDSEITAAVPSPYLNGIFGSAFTALRVDISNVIDPIHVIGGDVEIRDSWLHDNDHYEQDPLWDGTPSHSDSLQIEAGNDISVIGNRMEGAHNAAVQITQNTSKAPLGNVRISGNYFNDGGCTVNIARTPAAIAGFSVTDNVVRPRPQVHRLRHPRARHEHAAAVRQHVGGHRQGRRADHPQVAAAPRQRHVAIVSCGPGSEARAATAFPPSARPAPRSASAGAEVDVSSATAPPERCRASSGKLE